ncbi:hypothetical protein [Robbsia sp. KACC 23696]|uniref:hypothetical protein n=1 Tax=Robbsia sp. KACC 23696 TaxID=3149231 RepID=UPI00325C28F3
MLASPAAIVACAHAATLRTDRIQEACHSLADLAWTFANDHQNGVPLDEEEQRYSRQTRSPKVIEATYRLSEYMTPVQVQVSTFRQCVVQLRHTAPADNNDSN